MEVYRQRLRNNLQLNINNNHSDTLLKNVDIEIMTDEAAFDLQKRIDDDDDEHGIIPSNADQQHL